MTTPLNPVHRLSTGKKLLASALLVAGGALAMNHAAVAQDKAGADANKEMTLNVYFNFTSDIFEPYLDIFRKAHPNIKVNTFRQPGDALFTSVGLALSGGKVDADVIMGSSHSFYAMDEKYDHPFRPINIADHVDSTEHLLPGLHGENMIFMPSQMQSLGIVYNTNIVPEDKAPTSYASLLNPIYKDQFVMADPNSSTSVYGVLWFAGVDLAPKGAPYGWDYFRELGKLNPRLVNSHGTIRTLLASGEQAIGSQTIDVYLKGEKDGNPTKWVWPEEGTPTILFGWGTFKKSPNPEAANIFLSWALTKESQEAVANIVGSQPVRDDVTFPWPNNADPAKLNLVPVDGKYIAEHTEELQTNFNNALKGK